MKKIINPFQFVTPSGIENDPIKLIKEAISAGITWIQLRLKDVTYEEWLEIGKEARDLTLAHGVTLIINDNVGIAKEIGADGVHLGKEDMPPSKARVILGDLAIIGGTANTFDDVVKLYKSGIDYIGLGPFRFTGSKTNLSPILGLEGYKDIFKHMALHELSLPVVAIGGVISEDVQYLLDTGCYGIAVTGAMVKDGAVGKNYQQFAPFFQKNVSNKNSKSI
ncbi:MAG: thiamine-phosphate pyrophosphorylase [Sphingobacteriales bacterium]|jgi:thiamine-phosphate pyrophosphorylase